MRHLSSPGVFWKEVRSCRESMLHTNPTLCMSCTVKSKMRKTHIREYKCFSEKCNVYIDYTFLIFLLGHVKFVAFIFGVFICMFICINMYLYLSIYLYIYSVYTVYIYINIYLPSNLLPSDVVVCCKDGCVCKCVIRMKWGDGTTYSCSPDLFNQLESFIQCQTNSLLSLTDSLHSAAAL